MNNEIKSKLNLISNELENFNNDNLSNSIISSLDDILEDINYFKILSKENIDNVDIKLISEYKKNKNFINNIFPIFHYFYELNNNNNI